jgi:molecular chaperone HtpG
MDMFVGEERNRGIQLYVRRVFITDNCEQLIPPYLRFLRGVVDSADLPLNVSRELLQEHRTIRLIRSSVVKKVLDALADMMSKERERYTTFWKQFGAVLKEGVHLDFENREKLQDLILLTSSKTGADGQVSLAEYVARMPEAQKDIYYITAEDYASADGSPQLEAFRKRDYEVLYMTDPVDEWVVQNLNTYKDKSLRSVAKGDVELETEDEKKAGEEARKGSEEHFRALLEKIKETLGEKVKTVRLSKRLTDSACCLVSDEFGIGIQLEKLLRAMKQDVPPARRILELNAAHPVVEAMRLLLDQTANEARLREYVEMLYDQALLTARLPLEDPIRFAQRVSTLMATQAAGPTDPKVP